MYRLKCLQLWCVQTNGCKIFSSFIDHSIETLWMSRFIRICDEYLKFRLALEQCLEWWLEKKSTLIYLTHLSLLFCVEWRRPRCTADGRRPWVSLSCHLLSFSAQISRMWKMGQNGCQSRLTEIVRRRGWDKNFQVSLLLVTPLKISWTPMYCCPYVLARHIGITTWQKHLAKTELSVSICGHVFCVGGKHFPISQADRKTCDSWSTTKKLMLACEQSWHRDVPVFYCHIF